MTIDPREGNAKRLAAVAAANRSIPTCLRMFGRNLNRQLGKKDSLLPYRLACELALTAADQMFRDEQQPFRKR